MSDEQPNSNENYVEAYKNKHKNTFKMNLRNFFQEEKQRQLQKA
jgi:uncharacterized short protein YbdD (DUF466 family)